MNLQKSLALFFSPFSPLPSLLLLLPCAVSSRLSTGSGMEPVPARALTLARAYWERSWEDMVIGKAEGCEVEIWVSEAKDW